MLWKHGTYGGWWNGGFALCRTAPRAAGRPPAVWQIVLSPGRSHQTSCFRKGLHVAKFPAA
eukprot:2587430-Prymnesium_polylepis.1